jgi:hypothetical protein
MRIFLFALPVLLTAVFAAHAADGTPPTAEEVDAILAQMSTASGEKYIQLRGQLVAYGAPALPLLKERAAESKWTEDNWRVAMAAASAASWIENSSVCSACWKVRGLDPRVYRHFHKPGPTTMSALENLGPTATPALIEIIEKALEVYPFTKPGGDITPENAAIMAAAEKEALIYGVFSALAATKDPRAYQFLRESAFKSASIFIRSCALKALGALGKTESVTELRGVLDNASEIPLLRTSAALGLGFIHDNSALAVLTDMLKTEEMSAVKEALISALGEIAGRWQWERLGGLDSANARAIRTAATAALIEAFDRETDEEILKKICDSLANICLESTLADLEARKSAGPEAKRKMAADLIERLKIRLKREAKPSSE